LPGVVKVFCWALEISEDAHYRTSLGRVRYRPEMAKKVASFIKPFLFNEPGTGLSALHRGDIFRPEKVVFRYSLR
jgi:hypothetical protein